MGIDPFLEVSPLAALFLCEGSGFVMLEVWVPLSLDETHLAIESVGVRATGIEADVARVFSLAVAERRRLGPLLLSH